MKNCEKGQLSIFLGIVLLVVITLLAFIINVGLFVKAKINLQNAVDAAAWSGAAVQARQLTNMGYLNWEMRNNYKEWMFRYYVLGQASLPKIADTSSQGDSMNYKLENFSLSDLDEDCDPFNVPSICFHFGGSSATNICQFYAVPGLPRFASQGLQGISEQVEGFLDSIVASKGEDCARRSIMNFLTTLTWAYGTSEGDNLPGTAEIATHSVVPGNPIGAWPSNLLLAARMRNLEMLANREPIDGGICLEGGPGCSSPIANLETQSGELGLNVRPIKAFWSAFRNLSSSMKADFKLYELRPSTPTINENSLSQYLIPPTHSAKNKYYVDLIAYPLNLVTFYTSFIMDSGNYQGTDMQGKCTGSKTALPVPGYILGFAKNPNVLTYYAVQGETKYRGLFYPFAGDGITIKAYAAAKPFGGKIGPHLFGVDTNRSAITARTFDPKLSIPYASGLDPSTSGLSEWASGMPIPFSSSFFATSATDQIGGTPGADPTSIRYVIPNLLYDLEGSISSLSAAGATSGSGYLELLTAETGTSGSCPEPEQTAGLFDTQQFNLFKENLVNLGEINQSLMNVRQPTKYEALNYLIPTARNRENNPPTNQEIDSYPVVPSSQPVPGSANSLVYKLFAPLISPQGLYPQKENIIEEVTKVIESNSAAVDLYLAALHEVREKILNKPQCTTASGSVDCSGAANSISPSSGPLDSGSAHECNSLAGKFQRFYSGTTDLIGDPAIDCGIRPLKEQMRQYLTELTDNNPAAALYFQSIFTPSSRTGSASNTMGAYFPGLRQGATPEGSHSHPFDGSGGILSRRNYYSTKFIAMSKIINGSTEPFSPNTNHLDGDGGATSTSESLKPGYTSSAMIENSISTDQLSDFLPLNH